MALRYRESSLVRAIIIATIVAGTLDILSVFVYAGIAGGTPLGVLRGVGGAILDRKAFDPAVLATVGLVLHFSIMLVMVAVYMIAASRMALLNRVSLLSGILYGITLWLVMYWIVLPYRWPAKFPTLDPRDVATELFSHIVLVGIPIALIARAASRWQPIARHH